MSNGILIALEGPEGAGKSTQLSRLAARLQSGREMVYTREPGGTDLGNEIRALFLSDRFPTAPTAEFLLLAASRAQHVHEVIKPALERGAVVITDRFAAASEAYQGYGRGIDLAFIQEVNRQATQGIVPDVTVFFDIDPEAGLARAKNRAELDRFEAAELAFHHRVYDGFRTMAHERGWHIVNARENQDEVFRALRDIISPFVT